jgi:Lrp/AsnC family leucine-responsive transcriptional regulator
VQNDPSGLDEFDRRILQVLSEDGRIPVTDLALRIGLS